MRPAAPGGGLPRTGQTLTGMVKSYNRKGFGFIMCQAIDQDIYFSRESLHPQLQTSDLAGENVTFEVHRFPDGKLQARNLRAVGDVSDFRGSSYGGRSRPPPPPRYVSRGREEEDRSRDWYCESCGERNFVKRGECFKCKSLRPRGGGDESASLPRSGPPRRTLSPHAGSRAMREMLRNGRVSRSRSRRKRSDKRRDKRRSRKSSGSSSSSSRGRKRSKSKKRDSSGSRSGSHSSSSSSSAPAASAAAELAKEKDAKQSPEVEKAKAEVLEKLKKLREVEPREARIKDWRVLLREWHPDKNPDRVEVATAVFQFLQKGKVLIDPK